jgi:hypothetical protein
VAYSGSVVQQNRASLPRLHTCIRISDLIPDGFRISAEVNA